MSEETREVVVMVQPYMHSDRVIVLVPYRFWTEEKLADAVAAAIKATQQKAVAGEDT